VDRANISRILLSGGGAMALGVPQAIEAGLGLPVTFVTKLEHVRKADSLHINDERLSHMAIAIGLALGAVNNG